mmetsp:Transcript_115681/g.373773  ORF Transcript_115681/g.373773 Transcript_115681/m.373773 type:complete len:96 (-) Transcript_115681:909-1196(-)
MRHSVSLKLEGLEAQNTACAMHIKCGHRYQNFGITHPIIGRLSRHSFSVALGGSVVVVSAPASDSWPLLSMMVSSTTPPPFVLAQRSEGLPTKEK